MLKNAMGNLLFIGGDAADLPIKEIINSWLIQDSESVSPEDKLLDFSKIIPVNDLTNEEECVEKWGSKCNAFDTQIYFNGEGYPRTDGNLIYFDSSAAVPKIAQAISEQYPDLYIGYEYCDEEATKAGQATFIGGLQMEGCEYPYRQEEAIALFHDFWGRPDDFEWDESKQRYVAEWENETEM